MTYYFVGWSTEGEGKLREERGMKQEKREEKEKRKGRKRDPLGF